MKRLVILAIIKTCGKAVLLTIIAGAAIGAIGYIRKWDTSLAYSNAFFIAGCLVILAGASSQLEQVNSGIVFSRSMRKVFAI